jgi:ethanolamine ammonia-lyase large subunit
VDHHVTKLVCNIADTALSPNQAARETITIIREMVGKKVNSSRRHGSV